MHVASDGTPAFVLGRESLGASRASVWLSRSAADEEQSDAKGEDGELEGDAYGVLEAAL